MNKFLCIVLSLILFCSAALTVSAQTGTLADVNGDRVCNAADALLVLQYAVGKVQLNQQQQAAADMDQNGVLNASDALLILQCSVDFPRFFPSDTVTFDPAKMIRYADPDFAENNQMALCLTAEQLTEQLGTLAIDQADREVLTAVYDADYFKSKSLLLVGFLADSSEVTVAIRSLWADRQGWHLQLEPSGDGGFQALEPRLYWIEVKKPSVPPAALYCTVVAADRPIAFEDFGETDRDDFVVTTGDFFAAPVAGVCNSHDEMLTTLEDSIKVSPEEAEALLRQVPASYFETQSLILLGIYTGTGSASCRVASIEKEGNRLQLTVDMHIPIAYTTDIQNRVYGIRLGEKVASSAEVTCVVNCVRAELTK